MFICMCFIHCLFTISTQKLFQYFSTPFFYHSNILNMYVIISMMKWQLHLCYKFVTPDAPQSFHNYYVFRRTAVMSSSYGINLSHTSSRSLTYAKGLSQMKLG